MAAPQPIQFNRPQPFMQPFPVLNGIFGQPIMDPPENILPQKRPAQRDPNFIARNDRRLGGAYMKK